MKLALFDLDYTLLAGDSDHGWGQFLVDRGVVDGALYEQKNNEFFEAYKQGTLDIYDYVAFQFAVLAKHPMAFLLTLRADYVKERVMPMITDKARALVKNHLAQGDLCVAVTATNSFVTAPIAALFGIPHLIATIPAQENGAFTGKVRGTPSFQAGKITRVTEFLESVAMNFASFEKSFFYSDSMNDLPLLEKVTHPIAVNPDDRLNAHAAQKGWAILTLH